MENVKDKFKEGGEKLNDMKDNIVDAAQTPGEQLNEQLCDSLDGTDDENKMKIQRERAQNNIYIHKTQKIFLSFWNTE